MKNFKAIWFSIIIIIFVIILDFITVNNTKKTTEFMNEKLDNIDKMLEAEDVEPDEVNKLVEEWEKQSKLMSYYLEHDEIEKIGNEIFLLQKQIDIEDMDDARQSIIELKFLFKHIEEKQILNIENFF